MNNLSGKKVLVTGAAGTVGREIVNQLYENSRAEEIRAFDNNESEIFLLEEDYSKNISEKNRTRFVAYFGDVRDVDRLKQAMDGVDVVFHLAALKHVILCERSPFDAVLTNIEGVQNVINAAIENDVEKLIFTSSDKAVNPTSVMGTSKLMGERLITAANNIQRKRKTIFSSTRFGNVIGSRGSVIPIFYKQIKNGGPLTITDNRMTRFIMTISESASMVIKAAGIAKGGEVFVTKMPVIRIIDLADAMINILAEKFGHKKIEKRIIGAKAGEKLYEELMSEEETTRAIELNEMFSISPAFRGVYKEIEYDYENIISKHVKHSYISSQSEPMKIEEIQNYLISHEVFSNIGY